MIKISKKLSYFCLLIAFMQWGTVLQVSAQNGIEWASCYGGLKNEVPYKVIVCNDGSYLVVGSSESGGVLDTNDVKANFGGSDFWVARMDNKGKLLWQQHYGGSQNDIANDVMQLESGNFIVSGYTFSLDHDVSNHAPSVTNSSNELIPNADFWLIQINKEGAIMWEKSFGGSYMDVCLSMIETSDHNLMLAGFSASNNGLVTGNIGGYDFLVVKMDMLGNVMWKKNYGGSLDDRATNIIECKEGGFLISGFSNSNDNMLSENYGLYDFCIFKTNNDGEIIWQRTLGGSNDDRPFVAVQTNDDGFAIAGFTWSHDFLINSYYAEQDAWLVKLDKFGNLQWEKALGGTSNDKITNLMYTSEGKYILAGTSFSNDYHLNSNHGSSDAWLMKTDERGNMEWSHSYGGSSADEINDIIPTSDGGFIFAASTLSNNQNVSGNHGNTDYWLVKLSASVGIESAYSLSEEWNVHPNPASGRIQLEGDFSNPVEITVFDICGRIVYQKENEGIISNIRTIDLEFLQTGSYFIRMQSDKRSVTKKLIIAN